MACTEQTLSSRVGSVQPVMKVNVDLDVDGDDENLSSPSSPNVVWSAKLISGTGQDRRTRKTMSRLRPSKPLEDRVNEMEDTDAIQFPVS